MSVETELRWDAVGLIPAVVVLFVVQYVPIVLWEESVLAEKFGPQYVAYCQQVPRWLPRWRCEAPAGPTISYQWRAAFWSERSTFGTLALLLLVMAAKENLRHLLHSVSERPRSITHSSVL